MAYPIPVPKEIEEMLTTLSDEQLYSIVRQIESNPSIDQEKIIITRNLITFELTLRRQEPFWRTAMRTGRAWWKVNGDDVVKVAICFRQLIFKDWQSKIVN